MGLTDCILHPGHQQIGAVILECELQLGSQLVSGVVRGWKQLSALTIGPFDSGRGAGRDTRFVPVRNDSKFVTLDDFCIPDGIQGHILLQVSKRLPRHIFDWKRG